MPVTSPEVVTQIKDLYKEGVEIREIMQRLGVSRGTIYSHVNATRKFNPDIPVVRPKKAKVKPVPADKIVIKSVFNPEIHEYVSIGKGIWKMVTKQSK